MSATLIGNNVTLKVSSAVSGTGSNGSTLFTCAANGYAIVNIALSSSNSSSVLNVKVGSRLVFQFQPSASIAAPGVTYYPIHVGPSQAVTLDGGGGGTVDISGIQFINSP